MATVRLVLLKHFWDVSITLGSQKDLGFLGSARSEECLEQETMPFQDEVLLLLDSSSSEQMAPNRPLCLDLEEAICLVWLFALSQDVALTDWTS